MGQTWTTLPDGTIIAIDDDPPPVETPLGPITFSKTMVTPWPTKPPSSCPKEFAWNEEPLRFLFDEE